MPRARFISPDFWTSEAVVDCPPMTRLLLLGLSNFADDFGVLPLRPRTLRMQVFPGDAIDDDQMRAMIDELAVRGLVRRYAVEGVEYLSIVDWAVHQRVGKRARRRYPVLPSAGDGQGTRAAAEEAVTASMAAPDDRKTSQGPSDASGAPSASGSSAAPDVHREAKDQAADVAWHYAIECAVRRNWGRDVPADLARHAERWHAQGRDLKREVLPAIARVSHSAAYSNQPLRLELVDAVMTGGTPPAAMAPARENHSNRVAG